VQVSENQPGLGSLVASANSSPNPPNDPLNDEVISAVELTLKREQRTAQYYTEVLSIASKAKDINITIPLDMMLIPGGTFRMGSPEEELDRRESESPEHLVTVPTFFMGRYPVTQAQYQVMMGKNPSHFKGQDRPVETVSWQDATAFCDRLAKQSDRPYRLPTEAEWEYACRAGTTTPFHFGETITTDLANYRGTEDLDGEWLGSYGRGPKGIYRQKTTPVGSFPPNAFGLYDMHGNVWEWCQDHWHENYKNAPTDGSAWINSEASKNAGRLLRGGSWIYNPRNCRAASRLNNDAGERYNDSGFRVVCSAPRTR
jgi:formylglycine-generating enzyme required for sulfatase activity